MSTRQETTIKLPKVIGELWKSDKEIKEVLVLDLVKMHRISFRQGAKLLEMEYWDFLDLMSEKGVPVINYRPGEVRKDVETLRKFRELK